MSTLSIPHKLYFVSPVYYDVKSYLTLKKNIQSILQSHQLNSKTQFVVVDDSGGMDPEIEELKSDPSVRVIVAPFNLGHQRALTFGLRTLQEQLRDDDVIVTLDSDGEDQPQDIPRLLDSLLAAPPDLKRVVLAYRTKRKESFLFRLLYSVFKIVFRTLTGVLIRTGNFAAYRGWVVNQLLFHPNFDLCYSSSLVRLLVSRRYVDCERGSRLHGESHMSFVKLIVHGLRMMMPFIDVIAVRCLIVFSFIFFVSLVFILVLVGLTVFTHLTIPLWANVAAGAFVGLTLLTLSQAILLFMVFSQSHLLSLSRLDGRKNS